MKSTKEKTVVLKNKRKKSTEFMGAKNAYYLDCVCDEKFIATTYLLFRSEFNMEVM